MTAQIHDSIILQERKLSVVGINGNKLFDPSDFSLRPRPRITSCWRGFVCEYRVSNGQLLLDKLEVNLEQPGPAINGVDPIASASGMFNNTYPGLHLQMDFSGEILAADKFIRELYVHMGFHPAWKFETVYELVVSHGAVLETRDVSKSMAGVREQMIRQLPGARKR